VRAGVDSIEHGLFLTADDISLLGRRGGAWVPTIGNVLDVAAGLRPGSTGARMLGSGLENVARNLPLAHEAGVVVLAGTDLGLPHGEIATEAKLLHANGLSNRAAVSAASDSAYRYLKIPALEAGASADLVLFKDNPFGNVGVLRQPLAGMRAGRIIFDPIHLFGSARFTSSDRNASEPPGALPPEARQT
jgi:imidazolonepropionase-like amidohydrolase